MNLLNIFRRKRWWERIGPLDTSKPGTIYVTLYDIQHVLSEEVTLTQCMVRYGVWYERKGVRPGDIIEFSAKSPILCTPKRVKVVMQVSRIGDG